MQLATFRFYQRSMCPPQFSKVRFRPAGVHTAALKRSLMKLRRTMKPTRRSGLAEVTSVWATEGSWRLTVFDLGELLLRHFATQRLCRSSILPTAVSKVLNPTAAKP